MIRPNADLLTDVHIISMLSPFQVHLSLDQIQKIREYVRILLKWNKSIGLTSVAEPEGILTRHFGESMFVSCLIPVDNCRLADLGSGAGFPGLALKIACPGLHLTLIDSNKKKCAFLSEVVRSLELENVEIIPDRFNESRVASQTAEIVTARAVGGFSDVLHWAERALVHRGHLILWLGGEDTVKLSSTPGWIWQPAVKIPESQRRFVLIGRPRRNEQVGPRS
jgi:16S rRNA (guanine527-N7)-methyltransferase